jgi:O-antigen ligase
MPFHIFLSQWLSTYTGGLDEWKLGKDVVTAVLVLTAVCSVWAFRRGTRLFNRLVIFAAVYGALHLLLWAVHPDLYKQSALLGIIYNNRVVWYLLIGYGARLLYPEGFVWRRIVTIVLIISTVVAALGVLQYFLPKDILTHFGYSTARGVKPNFFIDDNPEFPRIMSTIRDPNTLAAYLMVPTALLVHIVLRLRDWRKKITATALLALHVAALYLTFSRSAWAAAAVMIILVVWWAYRSALWAIVRRYRLMLAALVLIIGVVAFTQRHNANINGVLTHATTAQVGQYDSNQYHLHYVAKGLEGIVHQPLGHGPGTAGLASIQNPHGGLLTENYYIQIGYEVGVAGLALFVAMNVGVYVYLWRSKGVWHPVLLASFWAYVIMNMLLQIWSNEAVALQWWLLAGVALAADVKATPKV